MTRILILVLLISAPAYAQFDGPTRPAPKLPMDEARLFVREAAVDSIALFTEGPPELWTECRRVYPTKVRCLVRARGERANVRYVAVVRGRLRQDGRWAMTQTGRDLEAR